MTGKDLVLLILKYNLLDVDIDQKVTDMFLTVEEAALKLCISTRSLEDMIRLGLLDTIEFNGTTYLHKDTTLSNLKRR